MEGRFCSGRITELFLFLRLLHHHPAFLAENVEVEDLEDAERVHDEENNEPDLAVGSRRFPERKAFPNDAPDEHREEQEAAHEREAETRRRPGTVKQVSKIIHGS